MKRLFFRGLAGAAPIAATVAFLAIDYAVAARVTLGAARWIESAVEKAAGKDRAILSESPLGAWFFSWGSTVVAILAVLLPLFAASLWMTTQVGRRMYAAWTRRAERIPVLGLLIASSRALRRKVHHEGILGRPRSVTIIPFGGPAVALGIVTGGGPGKPLLVLVPSSPFSLQNLLLFAPPDRVRLTTIAIDPLLRSVASWGIIPPREEEEDHFPSTGSGLGMTTRPEAGSTK